MFTGERCVGQPLLIPQQLVQFRAEARMARGNASQAGILHKLRAYREDMEVVAQSR